MVEDSVRRPVVAGVDGSECGLHAVRWAAGRRAGGGYRCGWWRSTPGRPEGWWVIPGSVSQALLHHAHCPVAVVRPVADDR